MTPSCEPGFGHSHDTKACTDATGVPWWYSVGFREDLRTFIGMRGHIANETQPMFNFVLQIAMLFIHGAEVMDACIAHMGDAKNEFINIVLSMIAKGGVTPNARLLLCAWHLTDRPSSKEQKDSGQTLCISASGSGSGVKLLNITILFISGSRSSGFRQNWSHTTCQPQQGMVRWSSLTTYICDAKRGLLH